MVGGAVRPLWMRTGDGQRALGDTYRRTNNTVPGRCSEPFTGTWEGGFIPPPLPGLCSTHES